MADVVDPATRSRMMGNIQGRNTKPERLVRSGLHRRGFRFKLHDRELPGRPDLVLPRHRAVVFVHGCFWHRHPGCRLSATPSTRKEFWARKFASNVERDQAAYEGLASAGWRIAVVWECETRAELDGVIERLAVWLRSEQTTFGIKGAPIT